MVMERVRKLALDLKSIEIYNAAAKQRIEKDPAVVAWIVRALSRIQLKRMF